MAILIFWRSFELGIPNNLAASHTLGEQLSKANRLVRSVAIWGAGETGRRVAKILHNQPNLKIEHIVDSDPAKWGERFSNELAVQAPAVLTDFKGELFVAAAGGHGLGRAIGNLGLQPNYEFNWIAHQSRLIPDWTARIGELVEIRNNLHDIHSRVLLDFAVSEAPKTNEDILRMGVLESYFSARFLPQRAEGTIVVGGAHVGEEIPFLGQLRGGFRQLILVEPSAGSASKLETAVSRSLLSNNSQIITAALGHEVGTAALMGHGVSAQTISGNFDHEQKIAVVTIDSIAEEHPDVSFITLDVEGDELAALKGGEKTLANVSPILAVSVYHKPSDLFDVWDFLRSTLVDYRYYLRALDFGLCDLTLFAIPPR